MKELLTSAESLCMFSLLLFISSRILGIKINLRLAVIFAFVMYCPLFAVGMIMDRAVFLCLYAIIQPLQLFAVKLSCKNGSFFQALGIYLLIYCIELILMITIDCIVQLSPLAYTYTEFAVWVFVFTACCVLCSNRKTNAFLRRTLSAIPYKIKVFTVISLVISASVTSLMVINPVLDEPTFWGIAMRLSLVFLALFLCSIFPVLLITALTNSHLKLQNEMYEKELQNQAEHYSMLARSNYELRRFRHDFKNIKIGITKCLSDGDGDSALKILQSNEDELNSSESISGYDSGNGIVDAILAEKQSRGVKSNTKVVFSGSAPASLAPVDLCVIFGNTVDNALEACERFPSELEKEIKVTSQCSSGFCFISISNPVIENVTIKNNAVKTTKHDSYFHGFGLYSLFQTAKKYDGQVALSCENNVFKTDIDLCLLK